MKTKYLDIATETSCSMPHHFIVSDISINTIANPDDIELFIFDSIMFSRQGKDGKIYMNNKIRKEAKKQFIKEIRNVKSIEEVKAIYDLVTDKYVALAKAEGD